MKIFLSWSDETSHAIALTLGDWIPSVIQAVETTVSPEDIRKGTGWVNDVSKELDQSSLAILCVVPGNVGAPWLNFEAGVLLKFLDVSNVIPLLIDVERSELDNGPLAQFPSVICEKKEMYQILETINKNTEKGSLGEERLRNTFDVWWPKLEMDIESIREKGIKEIPDTDHPEKTPDTGKPEEKRETKKSEKKPDTDKPEKKRDAEKPEEKRDAEEPEKKPDTDKPEKKQDTEKPEEKPEADKPGKKPEADKPEKKPDAAKPEKKPDAAKPEEKPEADKPEKKPDTEKPEKKPDAEQPEKTPDPDQPEKKTERTGKGARKSETKKTQEPDKPKKSVPAKPALEEIETDMLKVLYKPPGYTPVTAADVGYKLDISAQKVKEHLDRLERENYVREHLYVGRSKEYSIAPKGREYLTKHDLLNDRETR